MISRRKFNKFIASMPLALSFNSLIGCSDNMSVNDFPPQTQATIYKSTSTDIPKAVNSLIESIGGINSIFGNEDIIILKPNSQWWNQGTTNTDVMAAFIDQILNIPNFKGEIIIADNHQSETPNDRGWSTENRNGRFNLNELVEYFNDRGFPNVSKYHWHPAGANPTPLQFGGQGESVIKHPSEGDGYIWNEKFFYQCPYGNKSILAYPVFTSTYSGTTIDLKDGAFKDGKYIDQQVKFINFSALNHHGQYAGVTASIKNLMGVVDMSCGYPAPQPDNCFNTHHIGASSAFRFLVNQADKLGKLPYYRHLLNHRSVFRFEYTGGVLGKFMSTIRKPDLNIITAINIGWGSRTDLSKVFKADTILASKDQVALDYWSAKEILWKASKKSGAPEYILKLNNPDTENSRLMAFIEECRREIGGTTDQNMITVIES